MAAPRYCRCRGRSGWGSSGQGWSSPPQSRISPQLEAGLQPNAAPRLSAKPGTDHSFEPTAALIVVCPRFPLELLLASPFAAAVHRRNSGVQASIVRIPERAARRLSCAAPAVPRSAWEPTRLSESCGQGARGVLIRTIPGAHPCRRTTCVQFRSQRNCLLPTLPGRARPNRRERFGADAPTG